jgi:hypothetical protein
MNSLRHQRQRVAWKPRNLPGRWRTRPSPDRFVAAPPCGFEGRVIGKTSRAYSASISQKAMAPAPRRSSSPR